VRIARKLAAKEKLGVKFVRAPGERLPFPDGAFDLTYATTVLYWVERPAEILREMVRVTRPGGTVATLDPHASMNLESVAEYARRKGCNREDTRKLLAWAHASRHSLRFREEELRALLAAAGLAELHLERRMSGLVWFARALKPAGGIQPTAT
jgi:ubiquinone/menaquinone biosynthesis C-methylase UbiE